jgi:3',5'-cyclic AMP phosphodiesterase CpdA
MKKIVSFLLATLLLCPLLSGCGSKEQPPQSPSKEDSSVNESTEQSLTPSETPSSSEVPTPPPTPTPEPTPTPTPSKEEKRDLRVILSSDIHCTDLLEWYGVGFRTRMQHWVDTVLAEHAASPIDLLVINGDISLDYWINGGSVIEKGEGTAGIFVKEYLSQLPDEIPVFVLPGNHEQYADEDWFTLTGNHRQGYTVLGGRLFIFLDNFAGNLAPTTNHDGVYTPSDVAFIEGLMAEHPEKDVYLIAHYFDVNAESAAFKKLVADNGRIKALFAGHTHQSAVLEPGQSLGGKTIAQTGNFAYFKDSAKLSFWGFRELIITEETAYSQYIIAESEATVDGVKKHFDRKVLNQVGYYGTPPALPEDPDPLAGYETLYNKIDKNSIDGDPGVKESNRIGHIFDEKTDTKWCVLPTSADKSVTVCWEMTEAVRIDAYAISTANDHLSRNPKAWTLYGKNDPEGEWTAISSVTGAELPKETFTLSEVFTVDNPGSYKYYKLTVTENCGNDYYQFSELMLLQKIGA